MFDSSVATTLLLGSFFVLMLLRVPITFCLGISSILTGFYCGISLPILAQAMVRGINSFSLLAIPFFILSGEIMGEGGMSMRMVRLANAMIGHVQGGLAQVNILASTFFGGISGSSVADTSSNGSILIPMMVQKGYGADYSVAVTITSSVQGILIPPSHNMIIYSLVAGSVSVSALFMAGIVPGLLLGASLMVISYIVAVKRGYPLGERVSRAEKIAAFRGSALGLLTFVIVVVGVVTGFYTATEAAAVAALYSFIITFFVYRDVPLSHFPVILRRSLRTIAIVVALIGASNVFGWMLAFLRIPAMATQALLTLSDNRYVLLLVINVLLLVLGCIMDMSPLILITTPILMPVVAKIGMSPVHFGVVLMLNLGMGLLTPPVGSTLFVGCAIGRISIEELSKIMIPFYAVMFLVLMAITYIPAIVMTVPRLVLGL
ncbi:MAG: TRAP transporter large permease [Synergistaceae bacterium]|jgi:tripartite ATP-independent transporter DctM subunit|nr:TRAP transporter large permease [Synergistaceae bacterium]